MLVGVRPGVGEVCGTSGRIEVRERVKNVGEPAGGQGLRVVVAAVDSLERKGRSSISWWRDGVGLGGCNMWEVRDCVPN